MAARSGRQTRFNLCHSPRHGILNREVTGVDQNGIVCGLQRSLCAVYIPFIPRFDIGQNLLTGVDVALGGKL